MLNPKKLNIAYKRYSKNFVNGIKFEDVKEDYDEDKSEVVDIVESNNTKKRSHIADRFRLHSFLLPVPMEKRRIDYRREAVGRIKAHANSRFLSMHGPGSL